MTQSGNFWIHPRISSGVKTSLNNLKIGYLWHFMNLIAHVVSRLRIYEYVKGAVKIQEMNEENNG